VQGTTDKDEGEQTLDVRAFIPLVIGFLGVGAQAPPPSPIRISANSTSARPGDVVVLTIAGTTSAEAPRIAAFDRTVLPFEIRPGRWRALVGVDLDTTTGPHSIVVESGDSGAVVRATYRLLVTTRKFRTRTLSVGEAFVNPPPAALERIAREAAEFEALWASSTPVRLWSGPFVRPVPDPANSAFGTRTILNGQPRSPHSGADFDSAAGTPIKAPNAGRVALAGERYYTGNTVVIDHGLGLYSLFAHLSETAVREGDSVKTGDVVGAVGATGRVTGPHLHWSVRLNGARVDPLSLISALGPARR
jgi:murein DD-endopeptidase MepM/ murein hydrolase activator NlpD